MFGVSRSLHPQPETAIRASPRDNLEGEGRHVFRRDSKGDSFERQMGALREQLGDDDFENDDDLLDDQQGTTAVEPAEQSRTYGYTPTGSVDSGQAVPPAAPVIPSVDAVTTV